MTNKSDTCNPAPHS